MARGRPRAGRGRGKTGRSIASEVESPFQELLNDVETSSTQQEEQHEQHTVKKRRVGGRLVVQGTIEQAEPVSETPARAESVASTVASTVAPTLQTIYNDSDESEESDVDWEDVNLGDGDDAGSAAEDSSNEATRTELELVLNKNDDTPKRRSAPRRKPVTAQERKLRLEIHKVHILCLLSHVSRRNHWCNDEKAQNVLRKLLSKKTISYLTDDESQSQFQRNRSFVDGLQQAFDTFKTAFVIDARGMARSFWADDAENLADASLPEDIELLTEKADFRDAAHRLRGSRDIGAQLFCALLRSTGTEARLICSLQALPITATAKGNTPSKSIPAMIVPYKESRAGMASDPHGKAHRGAQPKKKRLRESPYPIYWVEAFNAAYQKWVPVDPLVTNSIAKPSKFEPPASDPQNNMNYVMAFEEDSSARDVTKRYAKAFNAKTRKSRAESTKDGEKWWKRVTKIYKRPYPSVSDQVEDAELSKKEAQEPMPGNVQDFKDHPYYALERHLKRNEVLHPRRETGKVSTGKGGLESDKTVEPIFRRRDVHLVKSADSWYRLGREIKVGEQPLKVAPPRKRKMQLQEDDESDLEESAGTAMYAGFQTCLYQAPPVVNGRIPRNQYGNLDVYVSSMVPPGGAHVLHADAARSARILGIDYADAVTGFEFRGRHGTAIVKGAVVAAEYAESVIEVIRGFDYERSEAESFRRSTNALRFWKRFLAGLRIQERIQSYAGEDEDVDVQDDLDDMDEQEDDDAGGFLPDREQTAVAQPTRQTSVEPEIAARLPLPEPISAFVEPQIVFGSHIQREPADVTRNTYRQAVVSTDEAIGMLQLNEADPLGGGFMSEPHDDISSDPAIHVPAGASHGNKPEELHTITYSAPEDSPTEPGASEELTATSVEQDFEVTSKASAILLEDKLQRSQMVVKSEDSNGTESGSLLSHDPEDDDADPEWLA